MSEKAREQLAKLEERRSQLRARIAAAEARDRVLERKARTHNLILVGVWLERNDPELFQRAQAAIALQESHKAKKRGVPPAPQPNGVHNT